MTLSPLSPERLLPSKRCQSAQDRAWDDITEILDRLKAEIEMIDAEANMGGDFIADYYGDRISRDAEWPLKVSDILQRELKKTESEAA